MVLVKIEPKEAVCFIKLRQSFPHSWDMGGTEKGSYEGGGHMWAFMCIFMNMCASAMPNAELDYQSPFVFFLFF